MATKTIVSLDQIQNFLAPKKLAVAGASRNPKKFGGMVIKELKEKGFDVYPVNPNAEEVQGIRCFKSIAELPDEVKHLLMLTPKESTSDVAAQAVEKKMEMIWIQQMSDTPEAVKAIQDANIPLIYQKCIFMFVDPVKGPHNFHRFFVKLFGKYPKKVRAGVPE